MTAATATRTAPDAMPLLEMLGGVTRYWVVVAAIETGLFDALAGGDASAVDLAHRCGCDPARVAVFCDVLADAGLLVRTRGAWGLSALARGHLTVDAAHSLAQLMVHGPGRPANLAALASVARGAAPPQPVDDDDAFWRAMFAATLGPQRRLAAAVRQAISGASIQRVLERGPCAGAWAIELLAASARASAVVECPPAVAPDVVAAAATAGVQDRLAAGAGAGDEAAPGFDVVVIANALRNLDGDDARRSVAASVARARSGALVVVADYFVDAPGRAGISARLMAATVLANTRRGGALRAAGVQHWLEAAGCDAVRLMEPVPGFGVIVATAAVEVGK